MKKGLLLVFASLVCVSFYSQSVQAGNFPKGKPFVALNDQVVEVKGSISSLEEQIDILVGRVDSIEQRVTANEAAILKLGNQNAALQTLITSALTSIEDINAEISLLQNDNENLKAQMAALAEGSSEIETLQAEIDENKAMIATLEDSMLMVNDGVISLETSLQEQIDNNVELMGVIQDQVALINETLETKQNIIDGVCPDGSAVQQINADGSVVCGAAGGGVSGQFESIRVYQGMSAGPGRSVEIGVSCPDGYAATSAGINNGTGWDLHQLNTTPDDHALYPNGAILNATNKNSYPTWITAVAACMRLVP